MEKVLHKHDVLEIKNFISKEESKALVDYWNSLNAWQPTCFYNSNVIGNTGKSHEPYWGKILGEITDRLHTEAEALFNRRLKLLTLSTHRWDPGSFAGDHADNAELDGTPNGWMQNKLVTILYLNDDYDGGYLTFRDHKIAIKPETGTCVIFDVGINNVHAVTEVQNGNRYTMLLSYDYEESKYDVDLEEMSLSQKPMQDAQKQEWRQGVVPPSTMATMPE